MVKVVENNERICTVNLDGSECNIVFQSHYKYFTVKNESDSEVYISLKRDIVPEADGVMTVNSKESATITNMQPNVNMFFASGSGKIQVFASNSDKFVNPFKSAPVSSGGGVNVKIGDKITPKQTDVSWEILANGSSAVNGNFNIIGYNVMPGSLIYVKAKNPEAKCKFIFQNIFSVPTSVPNTAMIENPYTANYDGLIIVPENATWICFSQEKTDDVTGIYEIVGGV